MTDRDQLRAPLAKALRRRHDRYAVGPGYDSGYDSYDAESDASSLYPFLRAALATPAPAAHSQGRDIEALLVPAFGVFGDDDREQGAMRRCLLCGRTSRIVVAQVVADAPVEHESECPVLAILARLSETTEP
ncbi:MAG: hypothetical protein H0W37_11620 [Pseudonocardiales bacterium]|nr:hypothetical protein [Pseudonocardiales bacterium]